MLQPGITQEITFSVSNELTAKTVGSGTLDVLATPVMIARMEQTQVEGRRLVFHVTAWDAQGPIGEGTHERAIIQAPRFLEKAQKKLQENQ